MRKIIFLLIFIVFASCSKSDNLFLVIKEAQWYLTSTDYGSGALHLKISGTTNGNEVAVFKTNGEGLILELDSKKNFNDDFIFDFFATVPVGEFEIRTIIMAFKNRYDTVSVPLNSGKLKF